MRWPPTISDHRLAIGHDSCYRGLGLTHIPRPIRQGFMLDDSPQQGRLIIYQLTSHPQRRRTHKPAAAAREVSTQTCVAGKAGQRAARALHCVEGRAGAEASIEGKGGDFPRGWVSIPLPRLCGTRPWSSGGQIRVQLPVVNPALDPRSMPRCELAAPGWGQRRTRLAAAAECGVDSATGVSGRHLSRPSRGKHHPALVRGTKWIPSSAERGRRVKWSETSIARRDLATTVSAMHRVLTHGRKRCWAASQSAEAGGASPSAP